MYLLIKTIYIIILLLLSIIVNIIIVIIVTNTKHFSLIISVARHDQKSNEIRINSVFAHIYIILLYQIITKCVKIYITVNSDSGFN